MALGITESALVALLDASWTDYFFNTYKIKEE